MDLGVLDYALDPALIAQQPLARRDQSRMLVVERDRGVRAHAGVDTIGEWLRPGDLLVVNDAEVIPARLHGHRPTGGAIEVLLTEPLDENDGWQCLARGAGRIPAGEHVTFGFGLSGVWGPRTDGQYREIRLCCQTSVARALQQAGEVPLPPYIHRPEGPSTLDRERYQTVFARNPGAIAAPTAGLHFTSELLARLASLEIGCASLTLLVGPGTFLPVRSTSLGDHVVPPERYTIPEATAAAIARTRANAGRIVAVGTTSVRALESAANETGVVQCGSGRTDLLIAPGFRFRSVDAMLTNLHLPRSSLLALVAAFAGVDVTLAAYDAAVREGYRFYSYGDSMLIL